MDRELDRAARCNLLIDGFVDDGRAELNVDFAAAIPVLTITGSFGVPVEQALVIRESLQRPMEIVEILEPIVAARRETRRTTSSACSSRPSTPTTTA